MVRICGRSGRAAGDATRSAGFVARLALVISAALVLTSAIAGGALAITNGEADAGRHPYVGLIVFEDASGSVWRCSGSLLSPTVVLTAGHCTDGAVVARGWFDEVVDGNPEYPLGGATSYEGTPYTNPRFCIGCGSGVPGFAYRDIGVVVLSKPVPTSVAGRYAKLPAPGLADTLPNKAAIDVVGYGAQERARGGGPAEWTGPRIRQLASTELVSGSFVHSDEFLRLAANPGGGSGGICSGDSGGPDLLPGSDTVLAVNSYGKRSCTTASYSSRIDIPDVLAWIESFLARQAKG